MNMIKSILKYFKDKKEKERAERERLEYIQKRVMESGREDKKNAESIKSNSKRYFFDSDIYGKIFS